VTWLIHVRHDSFSDVDHSYVRHDSLTLMPVCISLVHHTCQCAPPSCLTLSLSLIKTCQWASIYPSPHGNAHVSMPTYQCPSIYANLSIHPSIHICVYLCMYVCMCVNACLCVCIFVCTIACMRVCMHVSTYASTSVWTSVCMYVCTHVRMYVYAYTYLDLCMFVCSMCRWICR